MEAKLQQLKIDMKSNNLSVSQLVETALERKEGVLASSGALQVDTGKYTGRSPKDKFIVQEPSVMDHVDWGAENQPISQSQFEMTRLPWDDRTGNDID